MSKKTRLFLLTNILATLTVGCTSNQPSAAMSRSEADKLKNEKTKAEMIQDRPLTADSHFAAGQVAETQGDTLRAIEQYKFALKLEPKHAGSLFRLGIIYSTQQMYTEAIDTWTRYVQVTHNSASGYSNLGLSLELAGRATEAEAAYKSGIARDPNNEPCRVNYGLMLARQGKINLAVAQLQAVLTPAEVHYNLASVFELQGRKEQAKAEFGKALEIDPDMNDAKARLASLGND